MKYVDIVFIVYSDMGIGVELWRARIGLFNGGRGMRPHKGSHRANNVTKNGLFLLLAMCLIPPEMFLVVDVSVIVSTVAVVSLLYYVIQHSLSQLLLMAGDVESNPGPGMG